MTAVAAWCQVTITRKPLLYVINLIVPLFYLLVLDLASFFIHTSRGEKLSFKITVLLSISVLLLILQDMLPSTEDSLPMIGGSESAHTLTHTHKHKQVTYTPPSLPLNFLLQPITAWPSSPWSVSAFWRPC